jgi:hypothetical protein
MSVFLWNEGYESFYGLICSGGLEDCLDFLKHDQFQQVTLATPCAEASRKI